MIGESVGQFEVRRRLGEGGMGVVYHAVHRVLGTERAIKVLQPEWTAHPEIVQRFINEARAAAAIRHRNIIAVHDCGQLPGGEWYILLDYLEGGTLTGFLRSHGGPVPLHDTLHILAEAANGVGAAHQHAIIHRDLKPDNLFLSQRDDDPHFVTILDFGVAKLGEQRRGKAITSAGTILGTPAFMAPEQMRGEPATVASDVYALGVIAYQMVTGGRFPFQQEGEAYEHIDLGELYRRVMLQPPTDPRRWAPHVPEPWAHAILAALQQDPAQRPPSPAAFVLLLAQATAGDGYALDGLSIVRTFASELLSFDATDVTARAPTASGQDTEPVEAPAVRSSSTRLSRYRLEQRIGSGGMAEVLLGTVLGADGFARPVAVKRVLAGFSAEPAFAEMFIGEARLASKLQHPNIVSVLDFDRDEQGQPFLVMEHIDGKDLAALATHGPLPPSVAIFVASEVLRGLGYAHRPPPASGLVGLVHRDVSPHNVLLSWEGAVKVSDFGIAKALDDGGRARSSVVKGKVSYMSPEQASSEPIDGRSDLFAVGVMLWEMLTGKPLFAGTSMEAMARLFYAPIQPPHAVAPHVPADLSAVVMRLLERERHRRYAYAEDAIDALSRCAEAPRNGPAELARAMAQRFARPARLGAAAGGTGDPPGETRTLRPPAPPYQRPPRRARPRWPWLVGGAALVAIAGAVAAARLVETSPRAVVAPEIAAAPLVDAGGGAAALVDASLQLARPDASPSDAPATDGPADASPSDAPATDGPADASPSDAPATDRPAAEVAAGTLIVDVVPWASVWLNGKGVGQTPYRGRVAPGRHRLRLRNAFGEKSITVTVRSAKTTVIHERLEGTP